MNTEREELANEVWHDLPAPELRAKMSSEELSILLSSCDKTSPKYTLLTHELNIRLAPEQAKLNRTNIKIAGLFTIIGAILGASTTAFFHSQIPQQIVHCQCAEDRSATGATAPCKESNKPPVPNKSEVEQKAPAKPKGK